MRKSGFGQIVDMISVVAKQNFQTHPSQWNENLNFRADNFRALFQLFLDELEDGNRSQKERNKVALATY